MLTVTRSKSNRKTQDSAPVTALASRDRVGVPTAKRRVGRRSGTTEAPTVPMEPGKATENRANLPMQERQRAAVQLPESGVSVRGRGRDIECDFGSVRLSRLGYTRAGQATDFPLDRELNLADELYSLEVRQRVAFEAQRSSWDEGTKTIARTSGAHVPKRQAEELAQRAAQDLEAYYQQNTRPNNDVLSPTALEVASCDGKGVTMLERSLRESTLKAAQQAKQDGTRGDPMAPKKLRKHDKRMAIVTANWEQERQVRTAEEVLSNLDCKPGPRKPRGPRPHDKRVNASIQKCQAQRISEMFDEIQSSNPEGQRNIVVLVDGKENRSSR